jgi:hypothetical protein
MTMKEDLDTLLNRLGYSNYRHYKNRALWRKIRNRVLARDDHTCIRCNGRADEVHPRSYDETVILGRQDEQLVSVCNGCHFVIHFDSKFNRRPEEEQERILYEKDFAIAIPLMKDVDFRRKRPQLPPEARSWNWWQRERWMTHIEMLWRSKPSVVDRFGDVSANFYRKRAVMIETRGSSTTWRDIQSPPTEAHAPMNVRVLRTPDEQH